MAVAELNFWVPGRAVAQGNLTRNAAGATYDKTKGLHEWRGAVWIACRQAMLASGWQLRTGPVEMVVVFGLLRPRSVDRLWPSVRPDLDKLIRAIGDALTGVAFKDDAQIVSIVSRKFYTYGEPGTMITVRETQ